MRFPTQTRESPHFCASTRAIVKPFLVGAHGLLELRATGSRLKTGTPWTATDTCSRAAMMVPSWRPPRRLCSPRYRRRFICRWRRRKRRRSSPLTFAYPCPTTASGGAAVPRCIRMVEACSCAPRASPATSCRAAGRESNYCTWTIASSSPSRQRFARGANPPPRRAPSSDVAREIRHQQADVAALDIVRIARRRTAKRRRARPLTRRRRELKSWDKLS